MVSANNLQFITILLLILFSYTKMLLKADTDLWTVKQSPDFPMRWILCNLHYFFEVEVHVNNI